MPDEKWGEAVKAVVEPKPGTAVDIAELEAMCRAKLSRIKVPKSFEVWPELPRSPVGKLLKRAVRALSARNLAQSSSVAISAIML